MIGYIFKLSAESRVLRCSVIQWPSSSRKVHVHLLVLGTIMFLITALYAEKLGIESQKTWKPFMICYNTGLITAVIMLVVRGILQVLNSNISKALFASISGIAGIGHILLGTGLFLLLVTIRKSIQE